MNRRPCLCTKKLPWELNSFHMLKLSFIPSNVQSCRPRDWKRCIDSMLPCVCSLIDHRWRQNVVEIKKWHTSRRKVHHWCFYHILTSSVTYYWTDPWQHGIYLFYSGVPHERSPIPKKMRLSAHPKNFGNHVPVRPSTRCPSAPQEYQCKITQSTGMATQMQLEVILIGEVDWRKSIKLIGENRKNWGRKGAQGNLHWWRRV